MLLSSHQVGRVASVTGSQVVILLEPSADADTVAREEALQKGTLVKIAKDRSWVFGLVTALSVPLPSRGNAQAEMCFAELALLGEIEKPANGERRESFQRGVSFFPTVGDRVFAATQDDLAIVYARPECPAVRIGTIHQDRSIPAYVVPDSLLGKHFAILGTTGSGKSCAAALILRRILEAHPGAHVVLLDPHNEYATAFDDWAEVVDANTLELPYWMFSFEELAPTILRDEGRDNEGAPDRAILADLVLRAKKMLPTNESRARQISLDTPVPYQISDLMRLLQTDMGRLNKSESTAPYLKIKSKIDSLWSDSRYRFMSGGISVRDNMAKIFSRLFRIPVDGKPITILDLSAVPSEILNIVVSILCRLTFDFATFSDRAVPILLVCEEAHRYVPDDSKPGFEPTKRILSRIAKEGRKYGVSLCIVSQRPSDLSICALSQCNTVFALRLTNHADQDFVRGIMPDWGEGLLDFLPSLRNAEAIVVGEGMSVPARVRFDTLEPHHLPRSRTASFSKAWQHDLADVDLLDEVVARWRNER